MGSGGREHALAWKLAGAPGLSGLHAAPGNPGIAALGDCHPVTLTTPKRCSAWPQPRCRPGGHRPEAPLVAGVGDALRRNGIPVFGPGAPQRGSRIEELREGGDGLRRIPTAEPLAVARPPCVVKVDGLAAGKGVFICKTAEALDEGLRAAAAFDGPIVIEELLEGPRSPSSRSRTGSGSCRCRRRGTSSRSATATPARTRAGWGRSRPCRASARRRSPTWSIGSTGRSSRSSRGAGRRSSASSSPG